MNRLNPQYSYLCGQARKILQEEDNLTEIVKLVGKESLFEDQKVTMDVSKLLCEDFLAQNVFTDLDYTCPLPKTVGMLCVIIQFYDLFQKAIADSPADAKITNVHIKTVLAPVLEKVIDTKYVDPKAKEAKIKAEYEVIIDKMNHEFQTLIDGI